MNRTGFKRMWVVVAVCALAGAIAGIAGTAAAPTKKSTTAKKAAKKEARAYRHAFRGALRPGFRHFEGPGGPAVHAEAVVPKPDGSGFATVTTDGGTLNSVDGTTVHLKEGTDQATYKADVAIDVGTGAKVIRDGKDAQLSDLKQGDHVRVIQGPRGNIVFAADKAWIAQRRRDHDGWRDHGMRPPGMRHHGMRRHGMRPPGMRDHGMRPPGMPPMGPPPGAPAPGAYPGDGMGADPGAGNS